MVSWSTAELYGWFDRKFSTRYSHVNVGLAHLCRRLAPLLKLKADVKMTINKNGRRSFLVLCSMTVTP